MEQKNDPWAQFEDAGPSVNPSVGAQAPAQGDDPWGQFEDYGQVVENTGAPPSGITGLPKPTPNMFAEMDDADATSVYDAYSRHPNSQVDEQGNLTYLGIPVPKAEGNSPAVEAVTKGAGYYINPLGTLLKDTTGSSALGGDIGTGIAGGIINAGKAVGTGLTAAGEYLGILPDDSYQAVEDTLPSFNPEGTAQHIGATGGQIGAGLIAGNKLGSLAMGLKAVEGAASSRAAAQVTKKVPAAIKYISGVIARGLAPAAGTAATVSGSSDTLAVGPNAFVPLIDGIDTSNMKGAEKEISGRLNVLSDAMLTAMPVEMAADGGKKIINVIYEGYLKPLAGAANLGVQEKMVMTSVMDHVNKAMSVSSPEEAQIVQARLIELLKNPENQKVIFKIGKEGVKDVDVPLDVATIVARGLADDETDAARLLKESMLSQRTGLIEKKPVGATALATARPSQTLDELTTQTETAFGGPEGMRASAQGIQKAGQEKVGEKLAEGENLGLELEKAQSAIPEQIKSEGELGEALGKIPDESGSATTLGRNQAAEDLSEEINKGIDLMDTQRRQLYKDIEGVSDKLEIDEDSLFGRLEDAGYKPAGSEAVEGEEVLPSILPKDVTAALDNAGTDFYKLYSNVAPRLSKAISAAIDKEGYVTDDIQKMIDLRNNITNDQPAFLEGLAKDTDDLELADAVNDVLSARAYDTEVYSPVVKDAAIKDIKKINQDMKFEPANRKEAVGKVLQGEVTSSQPARVDHLVKTLSRPEFGESQGKVVDYVLADLSDKMRTQIKTSGLGEVDTSQILNTLSTYRQALKNFPEQSAKLDAFENNLIKNKGDIKKLEAQLPFAAKQAEAMEEQVYGDVLKNFFDKTGRPVGNGFKAFQDMFNDKDSLPRLREITKLARDSGDPVVLDGMKAAYSKVLNNRLFMHSPGPTSSKTLSSANAADALSETDPILQYGKELFSDQPVVMDAVEDLARLATNANVAKKMKGDSATLGASLSDAKKASNRIIMMTFGPLTRIGARWGALAGRALEYLDPDQTATHIKDAIFANPDEFIRIAEKVQKEGQHTGTAGRDVFNFLVKSSIYNDSDWNEYSSALLDEQAKSANTGSDKSANPKEKK